MSETTPAPQTAAPQAGPPLVVNIQFVKDLSFEVPGAPEIFSTLRSQPNVQINLDVQARRIQDGQNVFEVVLVVKADATEGPSALRVRSKVSQAGRYSSASFPTRASSP